LRDKQYRRVRRVRSELQELKQSLDDDCALTAGTLFDSFVFALFLFLFFL
jgi:hypothetical protein